MTRMPAEQDEPQAAWETVQAELADVPGEEGIARRREAYAPFFLRMGRGVRIFEGCRFSHPQHIVLDDDARINNGAIIYGSGGVWIGRHARIGPRLFIHSANHDVTPDGRAFFERGYVYDRVVIGENCLISANVSILPGARLGAGTFVACGAVVTQGSYPDGAWIMGVPGKVRELTAEAAAGRQPPAEAPSIALLTPTEGSWRQAAELLITALGLPQVRVFSADDELPRSLHSAIAFGPEQWMPNAGGDRAIWRLATGERILEGESRITIPGSSGAEHTVPLPASRRHVSVPTADPTRSQTDNVCTLSFYYAVKRLAKRRGGLSSAERLELYVAIFMLLRGDRPARRALAEELIALLPDDADLPTETERELCALLRRGGREESIAASLPAAILELANASEARRQSAQQGAIELFTDKTYLSCPEFLSAFALRDREGLGEKLRGHIDSLIPEAARTMQLVHCGIASLLLDDAVRFRKCVDRLYSEQFFDRQQVCVRSAAGARSSCYSPALAAVLLESVWKSEPDYQPRRRRSWDEPLRWDCFGSQKEPLAVEADSGRGVLLDPEKRRISRSLLDNWLLSVSPPEVENGQYELQEDNYQPLAAKIESVWMAVFRRLQKEAGQPLVRIAPWPHGYRAAFSVRYDLDRNIPAERVEEIVRLHGRRLNSACASWYAIPGTPFGERLAGLLPRYLQEVGVHALSCRDDVTGCGVTHHSAPNSEYWRGQATLHGLDKAGAAYGEMLAGQLSRPRPGWRGDAATGKPATMWLTPLHFPLEGSTDEADLTYFDRRIEEFRQLLAGGGHVIVGSHPDLDQRLLEELLDREDLADAWCATVDAVVDRCRRVMSYGGIGVVGCGESSVDLIARRTLADVQIEIDLPDGHTKTVCAQFNANMPRIITWD
ncbi:MAG: acyltransferase [Phycisphaerales bacterium]|nr:MAG: acyltransferase [Phycisphaerales bacterium]